MSRVEKSRQVFSLPEYSKEYLVEMDQDSNGSSAEDGESPRSVAAHSQIMRIRAEDLLLAEDVAEGRRLLLKNKFGRARYIVFTRPVLPASPLSGKTAH